MKRLFIGVAAAAALALAGCNATSQDVAGKINEASAAVEQVQDYAVKVCGFLPYASSIVAIFDSGYSTSVSAVGGAICNAVTNLPLADGPGKREPRVNGVLVEGRRLK